MSDASKPPVVDVLDRLWPVRTHLVRIVVELNDLAEDWRLQGRAIRALAALDRAQRVGWNSVERRRRKGGAK
jgi:hypothetical protein